MSQLPPDDFERRLRDVLHSRGLSVPVPPDAIDRIHAGARRRQQRRNGASALGAVAVVAIAAVAIGSRPHGHGSDVAGTLRTASPSPTVATTSSASANPKLFGAASASTPASAAASSSAPPTSPLPQPQTSKASRPASRIGLHTRVGKRRRTQRLLGARLHDDEDLHGYSSTPTIERTTDGGQHFAPIRLPPRWSHSSSAGRRTRRRSRRSDSVTPTTAGYLEAHCSPLPMPAVRGPQCRRSRDRFLIWWRQTTRHGQSCKHCRALPRVVPKRATSTRCGRRAMARARKRGRRLGCRSVSVRQRRASSIRTAP